MAPFPEAQSPEEVRRRLHEIGGACFPRQDLQRLDHLLEQVQALFKGEHPPYQAVDTAYHDLGHTLRVTACWMEMFVSLYHNRRDIPVSYSDFLLGVASCLLHDTGYLKEQHDPAGTGAKFTLVHEARSCRIARRFLLRLNWPDAAVKVVQRLIVATGPRAVLEAMPFISPAEKALAQMLGTADFLAQMGDPEYLQKLPALFDEFEEIDRLRGLTNTERPFPNLDTLVDATPAFWDQFVLPRLKDDYAGVYRLLNDPYPDGPNAYLASAEANINELR